MSTPFYAQLLYVTDIEHIYQSIQSTQFTALDVTPAINVHVSRLRNELLCDMWDVKPRFTRSLTRYNQTMSDGQTLSVHLSAFHTGDPRINDAIIELFFAQITIE